MPRLYDLNGFPLTWAELHARREAYYAARDLTMAAPRSPTCKERLVQALECERWYRVYECSALIDYSYSETRRSLQELYLEGHLRRRVMPTLGQPYEYQVSVPA